MATPQQIADDSLGCDFNSCRAPSAMKLFYVIVFFPRRPGKARKKFESRANSNQAGARSDTVPIVPFRSPPTDGNLQFSGALGTRVTSRHYGRNRRPISTCRAVACRHQGHPAGWWHMHEARARLGTLAPLVSQNISSRLRGKDAADAGRYRKWLPARSA